MGVCVAEKGRSEDLTGQAAEPKWGSFQFGERPSRNKDRMVEGTPKFYSGLWSI